MNKNIKNISIILCILVTEIIIGGYLFSDAQPRSILSIHNCNRCLDSSELAGLIASVGIQKTPNFIPSVVKETDKTIVIKSPIPQARTHFLILPKKDIKELGDISFEDTEYMLDIIQTISHLIQENKLENYKIISNGPDNQQLNYLHFHLLAQ